MTQFGYNAFGNIVSQTTTTNGVSYQTQYRYDNANRVSEITYPGGFAVTYARDVVGLVVRIGTNAPETTLTAQITTTVTNTIDRAGKAIAGLLARFSEHRSDVANERAQNPYKTKS